MIYTGSFPTYMPSRKVTWQWKTNHLKMVFLLKIVIFHCHVEFLGSVYTLEVKDYTELWIIKIPYSKDGLWWKPIVWMAFGLPGSVYIYIFIYLFIYKMHGRFLFWVTLFLLDVFLSEDFWISTRCSRLVVPLVELGRFVSLGPKWPLFWLEFRPCFGGFDLQK